MADLITLADFTDRTGRTLDTDEQTQVGALITDASALVIEIADDSETTDTWSTSTVPDAVVPVVVAMVRRGLDNPHGHTSEQIDDYSYSGGATNGVFATSDEKRVIRDVVGEAPVSTLDFEATVPMPTRLDGTHLDGAL